MLGIYLALIDEQSDKEKFLEIYEMYKDMMFYKAMSVLNNTSLSEEAVQESFLKIAKNIKKISEPDCSKTASFIIIIVRNTALDIKKKELSSDKEELIDDIADFQPEILSYIISKSGYEYLVSVVKGLDNIYSDVLMLKLVYGYDNDDISDLLNIPKRTVESRIYRGKCILKTKLEEKYGYI